MKLQRDRLRRMLLGAGLLASLLVTACGGGDQVRKFDAERIIAFGDETSVIVDLNNDANGLKYSVNATVSTTDPTIDCRLNPIWIQAVARAYSLVFPQCNPGPGAVVAPVSRIRATAGASVADLAGQIDAQLAESGFKSSDIATVLIGQRDILDAYAQYPTVDEAHLTTAVEAKGVALGVQVNRIAAGGAKVLLSTVPDLGLTPFAFKETSAHTDTNRSELLSRLTARFNAAMRGKIVNDGHMIGLILTDEYTHLVAQVGAGFTNITVGVCVPALLLDCTTQTLVPGTNATTYLWADDTHFSYGGQNALGVLATNRAQDNPF